MSTPSLEVDLSARSKIFTTSAESMVKTSAIWSVDIPIIPHELQTFNERMFLGPGCAWMCRKNGIEYRSFFHFKDSKVDGHSPSKHVTFVTLVTLPLDPLCSLTALRPQDQPIGQGGWKHDMCFYMFLPYNTNAQRQVCCFAETILRYILPKKK